MRCSRPLRSLTLVLVAVLCGAACSDGPPTGTTSEVETRSADTSAEEPQDDAESQPQEMGDSSQLEDGGADVSQEDALEPELDRTQALRMTTEIHVDVVGTGSSESRDEAVEQLRALALSWSENSDVSVEGQAVRLRLPGDAQSLVGQVESIQGVELQTVMTLNFSGSWPRNESAELRSGSVELLVDLEIIERTPIVSGEIQGSDLADFAVPIEIELLASPMQLANIGEADSCIPSSLVAQGGCVVSSGSFEAESDSERVTVLDYSMPEIEIADVSADVLAMAIVVEGQQIVLARH